MRNILFIYAATPDSVRIQKMAKYFSLHKFELNFWGWKRHKDKDYMDEKFNKISFLHSGGGEGAKILPLLYICFIIKLFFRLLFSADIKKNTIILSINLETALVVWSISKVRKLTYIYDIWDEMAISHNFPNWIAAIIKKLDFIVRRDSNLYIHVDQSRVSTLDNNNSNYVIIYNSPYDFFNGSIREPLYNNKYAVTGWLNNTRGLNSILSFARKFSNCSIIIVGEFIDKKIAEQFISLPNVEYHHFMPQNELFKIIEDVRGIFSLYDPSIEINRLAASNKLYDAMMLGIPVIVNNGILAAKQVKEDNTGYVVNYEFDESWNILVEDHVSACKEKGKNGRCIYLENFEFGSMMDNVLMTKIEEIS